MEYEKVNKNINTIQDLMAVHYGGASEELMNVVKADAPLLTTTSGAANDVYGAEVWSQLNEDAKTFQILPKVPYKKAGFRIKTARGGTLGQGGVAENGAVPDTILPTYEQGKISLKHVVHSYNSSMLKDLRAAAGNDDIGIDQLRKDIGEEHVKSINTMLLADADTLAGDNFESIDRVCSSQSEESALLTAGDADIYGFDRSSSTNYDAYVDHNSGTDRALTKAMIRTAVRTIEQNSGKRNNVIITGFDTLGDIDALFEGQSRLGVERIKVGVNGIQSAAGNDVMVEVSSVMNIPVIVDDSVVADGSSRIYFLNTETLTFEVAMPTRNFETNVEQHLLLDAMGMKGDFVTAGELKCTNFAHQGKIRDLS
jgi:hypothetical protein